jgi:hypothetical protein
MHTWLDSFNVVQNVEYWAMNGRGGEREKETAMMKE